VNGASAIDVSDLPTHTFGLRSRMVWAAALVIAIEGTMMALLLVSFVYTRGNEQVWPPSGIGPAAFRLAMVQVSLLLASAALQGLANRAAVEQRLGGTRAWLIAATLVGLLVAVLRGVEMARIVMRWDQNAYASVFWVTLGLHTTHIITGLLENALLLAIFFFAEVQTKHFEDAQAGGVLWYFVVAEWMIAYPLLYLAPLVAPR
jgi:cytochrome c oxidase subunit 3